MCEKTETNKQKRFSSLIHSLFLFCTVGRVLDINEKVIMTFEAIISLTFRWSFCEQSRGEFNEKLHEYRFPRACKMVIIYNVVSVLEVINFLQGAVNVKEKVYRENGLKISETRFWFLLNSYLNLRHKLTANCVFYVCFLWYPYSYNMWHFQASLYNIKHIDILKASFAFFFKKYCRCRFVTAFSLNPIRLLSFSALQLHSTFIIWKRLWFANTHTRTTRTFHS